MSATLHFLHSRLIGQPLLLEPSKLDAILRAFSDRLEIGMELRSLPAPTEVAKRPTRPGQIDRATGIAVYPIVGSLVHRGDAMDALSGVLSYGRIANDLIALANDPAVRGIMMEIDSGGGEAAGCSELADLIVQLRAEKPVWAVANTRAASAAYWIASAAEKVVVAPVTGAVGSVGVVTAHQDVSGAMTKRGVVTTYIYAGDRKVDGNPFEPLPEQVRANIQRSVDGLYDAFASAVAVNRKIDMRVVTDTQAAMYSGEAAIDVGLADHVGTLSAALQAMAEDATSIYALGSIGGTR